MSVKTWIEKTNAIGIVSKAGRYGGTYAIKQNLIPQELTNTQKSFVFADEADMLNVAMFGQTAKEWHAANASLGKFWQPKVA